MCRLSNLLLVYLVGYAEISTNIMVCASRWQSREIYSLWWFTYYQSVFIVRIWSIINTKFPKCLWKYSIFDFLNVNWYMIYCFSFALAPATSTFRRVNTRRRIRSLFICLFWSVFSDTNPKPHESYSNFPYPVQTITYSVPSASRVFWLVC